jgi:hypothetical protein
VTKVPILIFAFTLMFLSPPDPAPNAAKGGRAAARNLKPTSKVPPLAAGRSRPAFFFFLSYQAEFHSSFLLSKGRP